MNFYLRRHFLLRSFTLKTPSVLLVFLVFYLGLQTTSGYGLNTLSEVRFEPKEVNFSTKFLRYHLRNRSGVFFKNILELKKIHFLEGLDSEL